MQKLLNRLRTLFLVLFALGAAASWTYHLGWVAPRRECERNGRWWDNRQRVCATPIDITAITGRPRIPPPNPAQPPAPPP